MKLSARNQLLGTITDMTVGPVSTSVKIKLSGGEIVSSTITSESAKELELEIGKDVFAVFKSSSVMVGVQHHER